MDSISSDELLTAAQLAPILHLSKSTLEAAATRRPDRLPPPVQIPGGRRMWLRSTVFTWLKAHEVGAVAIVATPNKTTATATAKRGRGRPANVVGVQS